MENINQNKILSRVAAEEYFGRSAEIEEFVQHARGESETNAFLLLAAPAAGSSELLRQTFDRLFHEQDSVIPFYFAFSNNDRDARQTAVRFLQTFLQQTVAFRRRDAKLLSISPDICEISDLAAAPDAHWIHQLVSTCKTESDLADDALFIRTALSAPLRARANDAKVFVMIDDLHRAEMIAGGANFGAELREVLSRAGIPFVLAGRRRFLLSVTAHLNSPKLFRMKPFSDSDAAVFTEKLAEKTNVVINEQTRDLIVRQFDANPFLTTELFQSARVSESGLDSYSRVQRVANEALFTGSIGRYFDALFSEIMPDQNLQKNVVRLLQETAVSEFGRVPIEAWRDRIKNSFAEVYRLIRLLHIHEIVRVAGGNIEVSGESAVLSDYIAARYRLEILNEPRALVVGDNLSNSLKRAPQMMAQVYRRAAAINLNELLAVFNCQKAPANLFDYGLFKDGFKEESNGDGEKIALPQIVYTANTVAFYPPISHVAEPERSVVALGFESADYRDENEIVWIAAQIDSKLEASKELTEFWCDRLEMVALMCNFLQYKLWLITPEGFSDEAVAVLRSRSAFGSSRRQIEMLADELKAEKVFRKKTPHGEYEMILPMGEDTELIAAHAVEEIARRHEFKQTAINQIKTALVEACINATEHSHSPDRKIYQKLEVEDDKITITISNRGIKLPPENIQQSATPIEPSGGRRGWGLKLIRTLMDEVKFEQTDEGTRISMTKFKSAASARKISDAPEKAASNASF